MKILPLSVLFLIVMNEVDRLINLIYCLMFTEEARLEYEVDNAFALLKCHPNEPYLIFKYLGTVQRFQDFKIFERKVTDLLNRF